MQGAKIGYCQTTSQIFFPSLIQNKDNNAKKVVNIKCINMTPNLEMNGKIKVCFGAT